MANKWVGIENVLFWLV